MGIAWRRGFRCLSPGSLFPGDWAGKIPGSLTQTFLRMPKLGHLNPSLRGCLIKQPRKLSKIKYHLLEILHSAFPARSPQWLFAISPEEQKQLLSQISSLLAPTACSCLEAAAPPRAAPCCAAPTHHHSPQKTCTCTALQLGEISYFIHRTTR